MKNKSQNNKIVQKFISSIKDILQEDLNNSGIYWIRNLINKDVYIGSTKHLHTRKRRHFSELTNKKHDNPHLQNAVDKYKINNFKFEVIELCIATSLIQREQYYLDLINPTYNILEKADSLLGFNHSDKTKKKLRSISLKTAKRGIENPASIPCFQYELDGIFIKRWDSISEAVRGLKLKSSLLVRCLKNRHGCKTYHGYQWFYKYKGKNIKPTKIRSCDGIRNKVKYNKIFNLIKSGKTVLEISKALNLLESSVRTYIFSHKQLQSKLKRKKWTRRVNEVMKLLILKKSMLEMAEILHMKEKTLRCYIWHHDKLQKLYRKNQKENCKKVIQYDLNGKRLNKFENMNQASIISKCNVGGIYSCCIKIRNRVNGFVFRFEGDPFLYKPQINTVPFKKAA